MIKNNIGIIYHSSDPDGWCSGALAKNFFGKEIAAGRCKLYGYGYDLDADWMYADIDLYIFVDIAPPVQWINDCEGDIIIGDKQIVIFDHHKKKYDEIIDTVAFEKSDYFRYVFNDHRCGALIFASEIATWANDSGISLTLNMYITEYVRKMISVINAYDLWLFPNMGNTTKKEILAINEYLRVYANTADTMYDLLFEHTRSFKEMITSGNTLIDYQINECKRKYPKGITQEIVVNKRKLTMFIIEAPANYFASEYIKQQDTENQIDCIMYYKLNLLSQKVDISLRSTKTEDEMKGYTMVDVIRKFDDNGGGHAEAVGGEISFYHFIDLVYVSM